MAAQANDDYPTADEAPAAELPEESGPAAELPGDDHPEADLPEDPDDDDDQDSTEDGEQDLLVVFPLAGGDCGSPDEQQQLDELGDELAELVAERGLGEFDGDEYGGGECTLFFCGPDAAALLAALRPILRSHALCRRGHFVRLVEGADGQFERRREPI